MSEVTIEINERKYRMVCEDGQESHLVQLGERFNLFVDKFKEEFGEIGDTRLTVMAGIAVIDSLTEAEEKIKLLEAKLEATMSLEGNLANEKQILEKKFIEKMSEVATKIEQAANSLENPISD